jgi:membrane associated rhomboid family serine protease
MNEYRPGGFQELPLVVKNLLIINVLVFLLAQALHARGIDLDDSLALHYWQSKDFRWWQLITHMFMHGSWAHIFFNMFALWMFGRILENVWGPQRFLIFYMVCGIGAALCHLGVLTIEFTRFYNDFLAYQQNPGLAQFQAFIKHHGVSVNPASMTSWINNPNSPGEIRESVDFLRRYYFGDANMQGMINEATVGASGAIFGLLFAFGYLFPDTMLYVYFAIPIKAKWFVAIYAGIELFSGLENSAGDNIAHFAHLGGMLFAFILLRLWKKRLRNRIY